MKKANSVGIKNYLRENSYERRSSNGKRVEERFNDLRNVGGNGCFYDHSEFSVMRYLVTSIASKSISNVSNVRSSFQVS